MDQKFIDTKKVHSCMQSVKFTEGKTVPLWSKDVEIFIMICWLTKSACNLKCGIVYELKGIWVGSVTFWFITLHPEHRQHEHPAHYPRQQPNIFDKRWSLFLLNVQRKPSLQPSDNLSPQKEKCVFLIITAKQFILWRFRISRTELVESAWAKASAPKARMRLSETVPNGRQHSGFSLGCFSLRIFQSFCSFFIRWVESFFIQESRSALGALMDSRPYRPWAQHLHGVRKKTGGGNIENQNSKIWETSKKPMQKALPKFGNRCKKSLHGNKHSRQMELKMHKAVRFSFFHIANSLRKFFKC